MSELSTYLADEILGWFAGESFPSAPSDVYVALYNGDPGATGVGGIDVTESVRAAGRVAVSFGAISNRALPSDSDVDFGESESTVTVTHYGLWDAATDGNFLGRTALTNTRNITEGDPVKFPAGDLIVSFPFA